MTAIPLPGSRTAKARRASGSFWRAAWYRYRQNRLALVAAGVAAVIVLVDGAGAEPADLRAWVAERLRSTRAPERIEFRAELPYNETGKLLRRVLKGELSPGKTSS